MTKPAAWTCECGRLWMNKPRKGRRCCLDPMTSTELEPQPLFTRDDLVQIAYEAFVVANYPQADFNEADDLVAEMLGEVEK